MRQWAGSGKLTKAQWEACQRSSNYERTAKRLKVCKETVQRVASGRSWKGGWQPRNLGSQDEVKSCAVCQKIFTSRYQNGRRRSPKAWARKRTCSNSCNVTLMWQEGVYENR